LTVRISTLSGCRSLSHSPTALVVRWATKVLTLGGMGRIRCAVSSRASDASVALGSRADPRKRRLSVRRNRGPPAAGASLSHVLGPVRELSGPPRGPASPTGRRSVRPRSRVRDRGRAAGEPRLLTLGPAGVRAGFGSALGLLGSPRSTPCGVSAGAARAGRSLPPPVAAGRGRDSAGLPLPVPRPGRREQRVPRLEGHLGVCWEGEESPT